MGLLRHLADNRIAAMESRVRPARPLTLKVSPLRRLY
jgi:hypothetical protein